MMPPRITPPLPTALYGADQVRQLDKAAIDGGIPGIVLMKRAGRAVLRALLARWPNPVKITLYCGAGNNGGDGYIVAALARQQGINVEVVAVSPAEKLQGDAASALAFARREGVVIIPMEKAVAPTEGVIVDALLGTGLQGPVRASMAEAIAKINSQSLPVLSVDIPSGLCSDTGSVLGSCVVADMTVTFIGLKPGLLTGYGPEARGELVFDDLAVPSAIYDAVACCARRLEWRQLKALLAPRPADAHKGLYGHVMVIGGEVGFGGAVALAAEAALRTGAGLVSAATRGEHVAAILARTPEVMALGIPSGQALEPWLQRPSVLVVGPGLGRTPWSEQLLQKAAAAGLPTVVDADALNLLSEGRVAANADKSRWILTPHPGEAARLLGISAAEVQANRIAAVHGLQNKFGCAVLLKGAGTLIAVGDEVLVCPYGNPGMASGGMGDLLSGILGALLAQGLSTRDALALGVCLHALAGDDAVARQGERGLVATDLLPYVRARLNTQVS